MKVELNDACLYNTSSSRYIMKRHVSGTFDVMSSIAINNRYLAMKRGEQIGWVNTWECKVIK